MIIKGFFYIVYLKFNYIVENNIVNVHCGIPKVVNEILTNKTMKL